MEKIAIEDFVGIKDITLEIKQINILIEPQASGKSSSLTSFLILIHERLSKLRDSEH